MIKNQYNILKNGLLNLLTVIRQTPFLRGFILLAILVFIYIIYLAYLFPTYEHDSLTYHLPPVADWIQNHKIGFVDGLTIYGNTYPKNAELFSLWYLIYTKNDLFVDLIQFIFLFIGSITVYGIARLLLNLSIEYSLLSGILFFLVPINIMQAKTCYVDIIFATTLLLSIYFIFQFLINKRMSSFWLGGLVLGIFLGIKPNSIAYTAFLFFLLLIVTIWYQRWNTIRILSNFSFLAIVIILLGGYWYLRVWIHYGNPIYPFSFSIGSLFNFPGYRDLTDFSFEELKVHKNLSAFTILLRNWFEWDAKYVFDCRHGGFGIVWITWMIPTILWCINQSIRYKKYPYLLFSLIIAICFVIQPVNYLSRYTIYITALGSISLSWFLCESRFRKIAFPILGCYLLFQIFMISNQQFFIVDTLSKFRYLKPDHRIAGLITYRDTYNTFELINRVLKDGDSVYFHDVDVDFVYPFWGNRLQRKVYYLKNNEFPSNNTNKPNHFLIVVGEKSTLLPILMEDSRYLLLFNDQNYIFVENQNQSIHYVTNNLKKSIYWK